MTVGPAGARPASAPDWLRDSLEVPRLVQDEPMFSMCKQVLLNEISKTCYYRVTSAKSSFHIISGFKNDV